MPLQKFFERLIWACTAPLLLLTTVLVVDDVIELNERRAAATAATLDHLVRHVDDSLDDRIRSLQVLAASPLLDPPAHHEPFYREAQAYREVFGSHVALVDDSVQMLLNTRVPYGSPLPRLPPSTCRTAELAMLATGRPAVCGRVVGPISHQTQAVVAAPVLRPGQPTQFVAAVVEIALLQQQLDQMDLPAGWAVAVLDGDSQPIVRRGAAALGWPGLRGLDHRWSLGSTVTGWSGVLEIDALTYYGPLLRGGAALLLGLLAVTLVAVVGVRRAGRQLAGAVAALSQAPGTSAAPQAGKPLPAIQEITAARQMLNELAATRDQAQAVRLAVEQLGRAKLESALAAMTDAVLITDAQGRLTDSNVAFAPAHRLDSLEERHRTLADYSEWLDVCHPSGEPLPIEQWPAYRALRGESAVNVVLTVRRRDSRETWTTSYSSAPILGPDGGVVGSVTVGRDVIEMRQMQADLEQSHRDLQQLLVRMNLVEENERRRIAREIHDELQQSLGVIRLDLVTIGEQCVANQAAVRLSSQTVTLVDASIASIRRIVNDLRPQILDELGLAAALESMVRNFGDRHGVEVTLDILGPEGAEVAAPEPEAELANALYRITQESLNNVRKHAEASFLYVFLDLSSPARVELLINDDGRGLPSAGPAKADSFGVRGMRERAQALGGTLVLRSEPKGGTTVQAVFPR